MPSTNGVTALSSAMVHASYGCVHFSAAFAHWVLHVVQGANTGGGALQPGVDAQPKVTQAQPAIGGEEDVLRLDVPASDCK